MLRFRERLRRTVGSWSALLRRALSEDHTTDRIAGSFGLGVFMAMLPTLGIGAAVALSLAAVLDRVNRLAVVAAIAVVNPLVKIGVYALSLGIGLFLLGPISGVSLAGASLDAAPAVLVRLVVGNLLLAAVATAAGYLVTHRAVDRYRDGDSEIVERVPVGLP